MKKMSKFICLAIAVILLVAMLPLDAFAEETSANVLIVNGVTVGSSSSSGAGWSYNHEEKVLTLNGYNGGVINMCYNTKQPDTYVFDGKGTFTVKLVGDNKITVGESESIGMNLGRVGIVVIEGDGSLTVDAVGDAANTGIGASSAEFFINGGTFTIADKFQFGIYSDFKININGGDFTLYSGNDGKNIENQRFVVYTGTGITFAPDIEIENALYFNESIESTKNDCTTIFKADNSKPVTIKSPVKVPQKIKVLDNPETKWTPKLNKGLSFRFDMDISQFVKILLDGKEVDKKHYTVKSGSTIVEMGFDYMKTLNNGTHKLQIIGADGSESEIDFEVSDNAVSPKTGDTSNMTLWFALLGAAFVGIVSCRIVGRKKA